MMEINKKLGKSGEGQKREKIIGQEADGIKRDIKVDELGGRLSLQKRSGVKKLIRDMIQI